MNILERGNEAMAASIANLADQWISGRVDRGELAPRSVKAYRQGLRVLIEVTENCAARKIDKTHAESWKAAQSHLEASTQQVRHTAVNQFCEWLVDEDVIRKNPFRKVRPPRSARRQPRALTVAQVAAVFACLPDTRARVIVLLMVQQGFRCLGVSQLRVEDVDLEGRWLRIREKGGHERVVPLVEETREAIVEYLERHPATHGPLVRCWKHDGGVAGWPEASSRPIQPGSIGKMVTGWLYESGVKTCAGDKITPHSLRHTCATDMLGEGADIMEVRDMLGHSSVATTQIYTAVRPEKLRAAAEGRRYGERRLRVVS